MHRSKPVAPTKGIDRSQPVSFEIVEFETNITGRFATVPLIVVPTIDFKPSHEPNAWKSQKCMKQPLTFPLPETLIPLFRCWTP